MNVKQGEVYRAVKDSLNVRSAPNMTAPVVRVLRVGDQIGPASGVTRTDRDGFTWVEFITAVPGGAVPISTAYVRADLIESVTNPPAPTTPTTTNTTPIPASGTTPIPASGTTPGTTPTTNPGDGQPAEIHHWWQPPISEADRQNHNLTIAILGLVVVLLGGIGYLVFKK